jgi:hypothetical protein
VKFLKMSLLAATMATGISGGSSAQALPIDNGARVRIKLAGSGARVSGILRAQSPDSLFLSVQGSSASPAGFSIGEIEVLETWGKRRNAAVRGLALGAAIGAGVGIIAGASVTPTREGGSWCIGPQDQGDMVLAGLAAGTLAGALVGTMAGSIANEGWIRANLPHITGTVAGRGVQLRMRFELPPILGR